MEVTLRARTACALERGISMKRSVRFLVLAGALALAVSPAFADGPGGGDPQPPPETPSSSTTTTTVITILTALGM